MNVEMFIEILLAFGLGNILRDLAKIYIERKKTENLTSKDRFKEALEDISDAYELMNAILLSSGAKRVALLKTTNGGGVPRIGCTIYSSIVYEVFLSGVSQKTKWINQEIDSPYIRLLNNLIANKFSIVNYETMEDGLLKQIYSEAGIVKSYVYYIHSTAHEFIYLSINFDKEILINKNAIDLQINQFRALIKGK